MKYEKLNDLEDDELVDDLSPSKESRFRNKPVEPTGWVEQFIDFSTQNAALLQRYYPGTV